MRSSGTCVGFQSSFVLVFCISVGGDDTWDFTDEGEGEDAERSAGDDNCASLLLLRLLSPSLVLMVAVVTGLPLPI